MKDAIFTWSQREDLLVTAIEGGVNYWAFFDSKKIKEETPEMRNEPLSLRIFEIVKNGGTVKVFDNETNEVIGHLNRANMNKGEELMFERSFDLYKEVKNENIDVEVADVWFQYSVVGEITFG